jgi:hypothetical protein
MARRVLIYALVYGSIGAALGICLAIYTKDAEVPHKNIILSNGSAVKANTVAPVAVSNESVAPVESHAEQVEEN